MADSYEHVTPEFVRDTLRGAGIDLTFERAAALVPLLIPLLAGDAGIARLDLNDATAVGNVWPEVNSD